MPNFIEYLPHEMIGIIQVSWKTLTTLKLHWRNIIQSCTNLSEYGASKNVAGE